ncbi:MFS transporter [Phaeacidiphilus oryzae]|uniref:MFS transporter n=1 Tax=Phaeacidiphilus oryzae TaxID=348818 RepID=UPI00056B81D8|nr:MFS transporter [Phaeacidiphilus oryzae]
MSSRAGSRWWVLGVLCLAQLTVVLDNTVLNVAIPTLTERLGATTADVQWIVGAYSLAQAGLLVTAGGLADRYGRRKVLLIGLALFGIGSAGAALAGGPAELIAARAGMGVGGSMILATAMAVLVRTFTGPDQAKAIGALSGVMMLGFALGPLIGGALLDSFWWGSVFVVNIPVSLLALVAVAWLVPESSDPRGDRPDLLGAVLCTVGMVGVVYGITSGPGYGWGSGRTLLPGIVGLLVLTAFVLWERRIEHPLLDMGFFRNPAFRGSVSGGVLVAFGMGGSLFLLTQYLQFVLRYDPLEAGIRTLPMALTVVAINLTGLGAKAGQRTGTPAAIAIGMAAMAAGLAAIALSGHAHSYPGTAGGLVLMGVGVGLAQPAMAGALMGSIPPEKAGVGSGLFGTLSELGNSLGVAVLGAVLTARFAVVLHGPLAGHSGSLAEALGVAHGDPALTGQARRAFADGLTISQLIGAAAVLLGGLVAARLLSRALPPAPAGGAPAEREAVAG